MKFNYDFTLTGLDDKPILDETNTPVHAGRGLATILVRSMDAKDAMKKFDWAQQLYKNGTIDLDKQGQAEFKEMILTLPGLLVIMRGQLLQVLEDRQRQFEKESKIESNGESK